MDSNKTGTDGELKYLGFIRVIGIQAIVCVLSMYAWAKQHSGPFKFIIRTGERVAILVLRPIYNRVKGFPDHVLLYFDNKVDKVIKKLEEIAPVLAKKLLSRLEPVARKAIQIAQNLIQEAITSGVIAALRNATIESMQLLPNPSDTISNLSDMTTKGLSVLGNVPLVPTNLFKKPDEDATATSAEADPMGLSVLGNVPLVPTHLFKKPDEDAPATSAEAGPMGLSVLGNVPLVPTHLFKKPDEVATATSAEADPKED